MLYPRFGLRRIISSGFLGYPVAELEILPDFSPFVSIFEGLFGMVFGFTERMFGIANRFADYFDGFHHSIYRWFPDFGLTA